MKIRIPIYTEGFFSHFEYSEIKVQDNLIYHLFDGFSILFGCDIKQPEFAPGLNSANAGDIFVNDIIEVCIFKVSPENTDEDFTFRGTVIFEDGSTIFKIDSYKHESTKGNFIPVGKCPSFFDTDDLEEDGTYQTPLAWFVGLSGNFGRYDKDLVEIIGNIHQKYQKSWPEI